MLMLRAHYVQHNVVRSVVDAEPELFARLRAEMRAASEYLLGLYPCYMDAAIKIKGSRQKLKLEMKTRSVKSLDCLVCPINYP